jgi:UPF0755 protein
VKPRVVAGVGAVLAAAALAWALIPGAPLAVEIPEGLSARQTAELLGRKRVVVSVLAFRLLLKAGGLDRRLRPGFYTLREREWPFTLARKLSLGETDDVKIVIPEGWRAGQIAERLGAAGIADARAFAALVEERKLEGRLFPATYRFPPGYGAERAVARMTGEFDRQIGAAYAVSRTKPSLPFDQALVLASIVEREAMLAAERPKIAAVYLNRLKRRMPLQADPTVQYALGYWKKGLTRDDLKTPSPYNTYLHQGLPPGPICSPGLDSFAAVLAPAETSALYFVADMTGGHVFSDTNEQHNEARARYKKELRKEKQRLQQQSPSPAPAAP